MKNIVQMCISFGFVILLYKIKFIYLLGVTLLDFAHFILFDINEISSIFRPFGIIIEQIEWKDLVLLNNVLFTSFTLLNITILLIVNKNYFFIPSGFEIHLESFKKDPFYWISLILIISYTLWSISFVHTGITNYEFILKIYGGLPFRETLLEPFHLRHAVYSLYKLIVIYLAFCSKNTSLGYKLAIWLVLTFLIKYSQAISGFFVDAGLCFLIMNPYLENFTNIGWNCFLYALVCYSSGDEKSPIANYKILTWNSRIMHIFESKEQFQYRQQVCKKHWEEAGLCGLKGPKYVSSILHENFYPGGVVLQEASTRAEVSSCCIHHMQNYTACMNTYHPLPTNVNISGPARSSYIKKILFVDPDDKNYFKYNFNIIIPDTEGTSKKIKVPSKIGPWNSNK